MKLNDRIILILLIMILSSSVNDLLSQNQVKPTRQSSMEAYSNGNFEQAYNEFSELLRIYPKDPLYKYYSAVCLVNLNRDPAKAQSLLNEAINSASAVKSLPEDALFYIGRTQQMQGKFTEAIQSFNQFTDQKGKKKAKELNVPDLIQQCKEQIGKILESGKPIVSLEKQALANIQKENQNTLPATNDATKEVTRENLPSSVDKNFDDALAMQSKADSLNAVAAAQKEKLSSTSGAEKSDLKTRITENTLAADSNQAAADRKYNNAQVVINPKEKNPVQIQEQKTDSVKTKPTQNKTVAAGPENIVSPPSGVFSIFMISKTVTNTGEKVQINPDVPDGLVFRIQTAVFRNPVALSYFKGISPIYGFKGKGAVATTYYAGMFRRSADATKALATVKSKGFKDSFIVAFMGNKPVSSDRAAVLEKEWGKKPLFSMSENIQPIALDTIPKTLNFRVEVARSAKPLKSDQVESLVKLAGKRGLDIQLIDGGNTVYLIGNFITFESAEEYADLLIRNGYREAKVTAWLGKKEIDLNTAKQLFENLK